jgi:hypothetical protein
MSEPGFTCTGRGTHDPAVPDGTGYAELRPGGQGGTLPPELRCPVCGLAKRVGYQARQRLARAGITEVDISALPF